MDAWGASLGLSTSDDPSNPGSGDANGQDP